MNNLDNDYSFDYKSTRENSFTEEMPLLSNFNRKIENNSIINDSFSKKSTTKREYMYKINDLIQEMILDFHENNNHKKRGNKSNDSIFNVKISPPMGFLDYLLRIEKYLEPEKSSIILAVIYIDYLFSNSALNLYISWRIIYKLFFISLLVAIKFNEDDHYNNCFFAKVGGISIQELNMLEAEFCKLIDFDFFVDEDNFNEYWKYLEN